MADDAHASTQGAGSAPRTLRLTFRVVDGDVQLEREDHLEMTCPPAVGGHPERGRTAGNWVELRDEADETLAHRLLAVPLDSVEVHSPDGRIERRFGTVQDRDLFFEVLLPDEDAARSAALMGPPPQAEQTAAAPTGAAELARFELGGGEGGNR